MTAGWRSTYANPMKPFVPIAILALAFADVAQGEVYAYMNESGDYVVTPARPGKKIREYAVLTDDGEFLRLVHPRDPDVPVTHWRPWFIPKQPDPYDTDEDAYREREGVVGIEEVEKDRAPAKADSPDSPDDPDK